MYFRLNNFVYLTESINCTLLDIKTKQIYLLDEYTSELILHCEKNLEIETFKDFKTKKESIENFFKVLEDLNLGNKYSKKVYIDKYMLNVPQNNDISFIPYYNRVSWEITNNCNLNCSFCNNKNIKTWLGCRSCNINSPKNIVEFKPNVNKILKDLNDIEINELIIQGGNPLTNITLLKQILNSSMNINPKIKINIITNGTNQDYNDVLDLIKIKPDIKFTIVLFGIHKKDYKFLLDGENILKHQFQLLDNLFSDNKNFNVTVLLNEYTQSLVDDIIKFINNRWNVYPIISQALNLKENSQLLHIQNKKKFINKIINTEDIFEKKKFNACLSGTFHINANGDIYPCPEINDIIGNLQIDSLNKILNNRKLYNYWFLNKNKISHCKNCGMKYFCSDCSVFEIDNNIHNKYCPINHKISNDLYNINFYSEDENFIVKKLSI